MSSLSFSEPEDGVDLGGDVHADHVQAGRGGLQPHAVAAAVAGDLGLGERQLLHGRGDEAIARGLDRFQRVGHAVVLALCRDKVRHHGHQGARRSGSPPRSGG